MARALSWNIVTRLAHWLIAIPVLLDFFLEGGDNSHKVVGYIALGVTVFRLIWGFITKDKANFRHFPLNLKLPWSSPEYEGHNPPASWTYIFMWLLVIGLGVTGFMMGTDAYWGVEWVEEVHEYLSNALMFLVFLHFAGLIADSLRYKRKTWMGMFTGRKS